LISAGVVLLSLLFAFSTWIRIYIWSFSARSSTEFLTKTGIYPYVDKRKEIEQMLEDTWVQVNDMKIKARQDAFRKKKNPEGATGRGYNAMQKMMGRQDEADIKGSESSSTGVSSRLTDWIPMRTIRNRLRNGQEVPDGNDSGSAGQV
jgi:hypothetical protein